MSTRALYGIVGGALGLLLVLLLVTFNYNRANEEALAKAEELAQAFDDAGLRAPVDPQRVANVLGTDGGAICAGASGGLAHGLAKLNLSVGGSFYTRPVIVDRRVVEGALVVVQIYCPDKLADLRQFVDSQSFADLTSR